MSELQGSVPAIQPTRVRVGLRYLKNLGNFENVQIDIEIEDNRLQGESVGQACDRIWDKVNEQLALRVRQIVQETAGRE